MNELTVSSGTDRPPDFEAFAAGALGRSFATTAAFRRAFAQHRPGWAPRTLTVRAGRGGPIVAGLEGRLERRLGGAWLRAQPLGAPAGPLLAPTLPESDRAAAAALLWRELERLARGEGFLGGDVTYSGPAALDPALRAPASLGRERLDIAHVIDLAQGYDAWHASLRKRARQQFTKAVRLGVSVDETRDPSDLARVHAHHAGQLKAWGTRAPHPLAFYVALLDGGARLWVARAAGEVVCGVLVFVDPAEAYVWWSGAGLEARRLVAFPYLLARVVAGCGSARVSLGFSNREERLTDFKEQMGAAPVPVPILELSPRPRTPYHARLALARERARRIQEAPAPAESADPTEDAP